MHGYADHINGFDDLLSGFARRGILCTGVDQRGWGQSIRTEADRGNSGPTPLVLADVASFIEAQLDAEPTDIPVFVMGHSMGGQLVATLASLPEYTPLVSRLAGIMLYAPWIGLSDEVVISPVTLFACRWVRLLFPRYQTVLAVPPAQALRSQAKQEAAVTNPYANTTVTLETLGDAINRGKDLDSGKLVLCADGVKSLYLAHGTGDKTTSHDASLRWYDSQTGRVPDRKFKSYEGFAHAAHVDFPEDAQALLDDCAEWILERS